MTTEDDAEAAGQPAWAGLGLRERKRLQTMHRIQSVALDLFERDGFDAVTIERIAAESEVSPSSVYRHFGSKEHLVIWDEYDPLALQAIVDELDDHAPLEAVRRVIVTLMGRAVREDEERIRRRLRIAFANPSVEAASTLATYEMAGLIAGVLGQKLGRDPQELDLQVFAHALAGGLLGALRHWHASDFTTPFEQVVEHPTRALENGLDLG